jgi:NAD(P)-dependent dehydrogenase (short-subunit alcohol dehydrogenase family)
MPIAEQRKSKSWNVKFTPKSKDKRNPQKVLINQPNQRKANLMNNNSFTDKVALVTGGTSGIGKAAAIAFARGGAKVVLTGRREKEGAQVVAEIKKLGGDAAFIRADVAKDADVKAMVDFTVERFDRLDVAFNNAGVEWKGPLDKATEAEYRRIFDINVWGVLNSMRHEIPVMLKNGGGAIVNNSSVAGHVGLGEVSIYIASKHAVEGLTKSVALEFARQNIRVNAVAPGVIATEMFERFAGDELRDQITSMIPVGRRGVTEEIAAAVLYLCSDDAGFTTGTSLVVDGGWIAQ